MIERLLARAFSVLASYGLACVLLSLLFLLTLLGTLEQADHGLFVVQERYFESLFFVHYLGGRVPVPLPGAYLLLGLLTVNLICGGIVRLRKRRSVAGVLVCHLGVVLMIVAGFVQYRYAVDGHMTLYEQGSSSEFVSYFEWELVIAETGRVASESTPLREHVVPGELFADLRGAGHGRAFVREGLPFDLRVTRFFENCELVPAGQVVEADADTASPVVDGSVLRQRSPEHEAELNLAGACVEVLPHDGAAAIPALLHALAGRPLVLELGGESFAITLQRRRWLLPFTVRLDAFHRDLHPGTSMAAAFASDVVWIQGGRETPVTIEMNEPLRLQGYTLYQASWGPENARAGEPLFSRLAVVRNPADRWPLYSCIVIAVGLLLHFGSKLRAYLRATAPVRAAGVPA